MALYWLCFCSNYDVLSMNNDDNNNKEHSESADLRRTKFEERETF